MKFRYAILASALTLAATAAAQTPNPASAKIDALLADVIATEPGCAIRITQNGAVISERGFGMADLEHDIAITPATIFEAGSVSKQFTAAAILLLEKDGKLKLSDDIRKYLPEMPVYEAPITVEMLLNHTSGLRDWGSVAFASGKPRGERNFSNDEVLEMAARQKHLNYKPGAEYSYTNTGYNLAAEIVKRVSGKSFMDFTQERLFQPLGMTHSQWRDDHTHIVKNRAMAYEPSPGGAQKTSMPFMNVYGNGGLLTTVADLSTWNDAMTADKLGIRAAMEHNSKLNDGREIPYARGVIVQPYNGVNEVAHSGSTGGYIAWLARYPDQKMSIAMLCNGQPTKFPGIKEITNVVVPAKVEAPSTAKFKDAAAYSGRFINTATGFPMNFRTNADEMQINGRAAPRLSDTSWLRGQDKITFTSNDKFRLDKGDGNRFDYVRTPAVTLTADQLKEYEGTYVSDEATATYTVKVEGSALAVHIAHWPDTEIQVMPSYKDAFLMGGLLVRFKRDAGGRITAMTLGDGRMRELTAPRS